MKTLLALKVEINAPSMILGKQVIIKSVIPISDVPTL